MHVERYAETKNVSAAGVLMAPLEMLPSGTKVDMQIGIPSAYISSLPGAQLNSPAMVVRSEPIEMKTAHVFGSKVALKFLDKPKITTKITMFD